MADAKTAKIVLVTEDGQSMSLDRSCAEQIGVLQAMLKATRDETLPTKTFPLTSVKSTTLAKIIEYLEQHKEDAPEPSKILPITRVNDSTKPPPSSSILDDDPDDDLKETMVEVDGSSESSGDEEYLYEEYLANVTPWDQKFMSSMDLPGLIEITKAANYLNIPKLLDLCCRSIAKQMTGLKTEELRKKFNLPNDFSPEEEAKLAAEFAWIDE